MGTSRLVGLRGGAEPSAKARALQGLPPKKGALQTEAAGSQTQKQAFKPFQSSPGRNGPPYAGGWRRSWLTGQRLTSEWEQHRIAAHNG